MKEGNLQIVEYNSDYQQRFREINEQWITRSFALEEEDTRTLSNPEKYILINSGKLYIALYDDFPVGTCGYLNFGNHTYEMIKMAVDEKYRGLKIGRIILEESINRIRTLGARKIFLYSNTKGSEVAINLYYKLGFVKIDLGEPEFERADIKMELLLQLVQTSN